MTNMPQRIHRVLSIAVIIFSVLFAFTACKKQPPPPPPAKGSLVGEGGGCYPYTVHGTYYNGIPAPDTNYVEIHVDVTSPGSYKITTQQENGVSFSASGTFTDTGLNVVHLKSTGTFLADTIIDFHTSFDSTSCIFRVSIEDSAELSIADNTWEFTAGGHLYHGPGHAVYANFVGGSFYFTFFGSMAGYSDTSLTIRYRTFPTDPVTCSHPTTGDANSFRFTTSIFSADPKVFFTASPSTLPAVIDITHCSSHLYYFNGTARDSAGNIVPITNARFRADHPDEAASPQ
ncbi:hypothetical protein Q4E93_19775 [Flavitalea sp. BT771]|uniref:hypothetical protein n=1 Tax=Flavitalea sp. BT771 TaxID=3063329 RepID=UPI0026E40761|nr:hypothetical protein [Flavitalea sp. BT771]MDO6432857.1 hypothetical protein [Flavitalea sp. BT771]MDV6221867.1 hypothetical protein [Flavitalea sp. BT771]